MYEAVFHFHRRPFPSAPQADFYFPAGTSEHAHQTLARCIERAEGPALLIGGSGMGKSLHCQLLAQRFRERFFVAKLDSARLNTRRALLQNILFELNQPFRGLDESELQLSLVDFLEPRDAAREGLLLIVDEGQHLRGRLIEELRLITNLVRGGQPRVRLLLAGTPSLEERLAHPKLESLNQRLAVRCYLQPLTYDETLNYVRSQIAKAGGHPDHLCSSETLQAVYHASGGVPRLINQVCDHALLLAAAAHRDRLDVVLIEEAWADLQQLPVPSARKTQDAAAAGSVIEFGTLDAAPAAALDLTGRLDTIEQQVAELHAAESTAVEFGWTPDAPVAAPRSPDPFAESFEHEEAVVDHYAALESATRLLQAATVSLQEREFNAAIETIFCGQLRTPATPTAPPIASVTSVAPVAAAHFPPEETIAVLPAVPELLDDADVDLPEHEPVVDDEPEAATAGVVRTLPADDSDLILIVDQEEFGPPGLSSRTQRREYRDLFTRLREG